LAAASLSKGRIPAGESALFDTGTCGRSPWPACCRRGAPLRRDL